MFEVEKKFILKEGDESKLINGADFSGERKFTDSYYDTDDYSLTTKDIWLRERDDKFELKVPFNDSLNDRVSDQYQELETDREIAEYLKLSSGNPLASSLAQNGYGVFCSVTTTRKKYKKAGFTIDLDTVDFGYEIAEIEYMVDDISKMHEATEKIVKFAKDLGLTEGSVTRGKVAEYLRINDFVHFQALVDAKVVK
jgi:thiamine-triphosphatase